MLAPLVAGLSLFAITANPNPRANVEERLRAIIALTNAQPAPADAPAPAPGEAAPGPPPSTPSASPPVAPRDPFLAPSPMSTTSPSFGGVPSPGLAAPLVLLALAAAAAFFFRQRVTAPGRLLHILESVPVGRGRALFIADVAGRKMLLATSEAGITVLADGIAVPDEGLQRSTDGSQADKLGRLRGFFSGTLPQETSFVTDASACDEDTELRRKLQMGRKNV